MGKLWLGILWLLVLSSCVKNTGSEEGPDISILNPKPCDTIYFDQTFVFRMTLDGDYLLGNVSMDIHHNFGQHSHGNHISCVYDIPKSAIRPFARDWVFSLPQNEKKAIFEHSFLFPKLDEGGTPFDAGDYHFHIYVTNQEGYLTFTTLDIKLLHE